MVENDARISALESEIADLQSKLREAQAALAAAEQQAEREAQNARSAAEEMQHFVYAVSHDLREPLRGVLTSAQMLDRDPVLRERALDSTSAIIEGSLKMNSLIDRLLTFSRIASNLRRTIVPLTPVVQWALMNLGKTVTESGARISYDSLPTLDIDDSVFSTLLQEVLTNSILYCRAGVPPEVVISAERSDGGHTIAVRDNGCGIEPGQLEKVFAPFHRVHQKADVKGYGLGLSICRKIVRAHGGKIWAESNGRTGCTVFIEVPD